MFVAAVATAATACSDNAPLGPPDIETAYLDLYVPDTLDLANRICRVTQDGLDDHVESLADEFGLQIPAPIPVFISTGAPEACRVGASGCFLSNGEVHSEWSSLEHELVHAVVEQRGPLSTFWSEGIAVAYEPRRLTGGPFPVAGQFNVEDFRELDYDAAGHFVRWIRTEFGSAPIVRLANGVPPTEAFDLPTETLEEMYQQEAPWSLAGAPDCIGDRLVVQNGRLSGSTYATCDESSVRNSDRALPASYFLIQIEEAGRYELSASTEAADKTASATLLYCVEGDVLEPQSTTVEDVQSTLAARPNTTFKSTRGPSVELNLAPGEHMLIVDAIGGERVDFSLTRID